MTSAKYLVGLLKQHGIEQVLSWTGVGPKAHEIVHGAVSKGIDLTNWQAHATDGAVLFAQVHYPDTKDHSLLTASKYDHVPAEVLPDATMVLWLNATSSPEWTTMLADLRADGADVVVVYGSN